MTCGAVTSSVETTCSSGTISPLARPRIELPQRLRVGSEPLLGLHVDAVCAVVELEVVHVLRAEQDLHRAGDFVERQAQRQRPLAVDRDLQLRIVRGERAEQPPHDAGLVSGPGNGLRGGRPGCVMSCAGLIEHLELEPAEPAQARNRRWGEADDDRARQAEERPAEPPEHRLDAECSAPGRSSNGLSRANMSPWFGAAPLKLKPMTENSASTSGSLRMIFSACRATLPVYSSDAPAGAWT